MGTMTQPARPGPRERLLLAARELTYSQGASVGVDAILAQADVARRSLYQHFGGKDGLVTAVVRAESDAQIERYEAALDAGGDRPRARLLSVFDEMDRVTSAPGYRGCRFMKMEMALADPEHPAHAEVRAHKQRVYGLLLRELEALGHPDPENAARRMHVIVEGVFAVGALQPETHPAVAARPLAVSIMDEAGTGRT